MNIITGVTGILAATAIGVGAKSAADFAEAGGIEDWKPEDYEYETDCEVIPEPGIPWTDTEDMSYCEMDNNVRLWELAHQYQVEAIFEHDDFWIESQSDEMYSRYKCFRKDPMFQQLSSIQLQEYELTSETGTTKVTIANDYYTGESFMWQEEI